MSDTADRFADILVSIEEDAKELRENPESFWSTDYMERSIEERRWLVSRVRTLEAQAAAQKAVVEAAQRLVDSKKRLVYSAGVGAMCVTLAAFGEWSEYETALDAALAALDGERKEGEG